MSALFSPCRSWRYSLERQVGDLFSAGSGSAVVCFIGLNPSTADENVDDATVRRCKAFARDWGFGVYRMLNVYAWRSTDPRALPKVKDPVGPDNDVHLIRGTKDAGLVVCAWGTHVNDAVATREADIVGMLRAAGRTLHCLRTNTDGTPAHPLYLPGSLRPMLFAGAGR